MVRSKPRQSFWRKVQPACMDNERKGEKSVNVIVDGVEEEFKGQANSGKTLVEKKEENGECSLRNAVKYKRITGIVETKDLWNLNVAWLDRCLLYKAAEMRIN
ncbi:hypothetical protein V6N13_060832 [Hibiscus sabdariffa]